ncbi:hypothetical protein GF325_01430 [Candidatus Bathyarchaeota archaeon]|nr:hypothetical protein [Candidatus Bathyarchaeota archaeon]
MLQIQSLLSDNLHSILFFCLFVWYLVFAFLSLFHAIKLQKQEPFLLLLYALWESFFALILSFAFIDGLRSLLLLAFAVDIKIVALLVFDILYHELFHEGPAYSWGLNRYSIGFILVFIGGHTLIAHYDITGNPLVLSILPVFASVGLGIVIYLYIKTRQQFTSLIEYMVKESRFVEEKNTWKVKVVLTQYKFIGRSFLIYPLAFLLMILSFISFAVNLGTIDDIMLETSIFFIFVASSYQVLGFFYPLPAWTELCREI